MLSCGVTVSTIKFECLSCVSVSSAVKSKPTFSCASMSEGLLVRPLFFFRTHPVKGIP